MAATFVIDEEGVREWLDTEGNAGNLTDRQKEAFVEAVMSDLEGGAVCLFTLVAHLIQDQLSVWPEDFEDEDEEDED